MDRLHGWMIAQRDLVPEGSAISRALDYSLKRWAALSRYLDDGAVPIDNNWAENQIRPWALGRKNWLFAGSLRSGKRAAAIMSMIQSARLNRSEEHTSELQSLMRISYAVFCLKKKKINKTAQQITQAKNPYNN